MALSALRRNGGLLTLVVARVTRSASARASTCYLSSMRLRGTQALCVALFALLAGCKGTDAAAREAFARAESCPPSSITVTPRKDAEAMAHFYRPPSEQPPDEIARDPARLAQWKQTHAEDDAWVRKSLEDYDLFEVKGCGHTSFYKCTNYYDGDAHSCDRETYAPPAPPGPATPR